jgi:hypothetical protein
MVYNSLCTRIACVYRILLYYKKILWYYRNINLTTKSNYEGHETFPLLMEVSWLLPKLFRILR